MLLKFALSFFGQWILQTSDTVVLPNLLRLLANGLVIGKIMAAVIPFKIEYESAAVATLVKARRQMRVTIGRL